MLVAFKLKEGSADALHKFNNAFWSALTSD